MRWFVVFVVWGISEPLQGNETPNQELQLVSTEELQLSSRQDSGQEYDQVWVFDKKQRRRVLRQGTIAEFNQQSLQLVGKSGTPSRISTSDIVEYQTVWSDAKERGDRLLRQANYSEARKAFREAYGEESRKWARREIRAQLVALERYLGNNEKACREFLAMCVEEPQHRHWDVIPIPWRGERPDGLLERQLQTWIESAEPTAQLIAAAWLMSTAEREAAVTALRSLSRTNRAEVGMLAAQQLWRIETVNQNAKLADWSEKLDAFPSEVRGGGYYLVGVAMRNRGRDQEATLQFMRVRILFPRTHDLAALSLYAAGKSLQKLNRENEAKLVFRELTNKYPDSDWAKQVAGEPQDRSNDDFIR